MSPPSIPPAPPPTSRGMGTLLGIIGVFLAVIALWFTAVPAGIQFGSTLIAILVPSVLYSYRRGRRDQWCADTGSPRTGWRLELRAAPREPHRNDEGPA